MIPFPNVKPEIFSVSVGGLELALRWYALAYIVGFFLALALMKFFLKRDFFWLNHRKPMLVDQADSILTYLIMGVILGGRIGYVLFYNFDFYLANPMDIIRIWDGGMSFHGGFLGVVFSILLYSRMNQLELWSVADLIATATPPGLFLGRLANFINAELWGRPTNMPWGVIFPGELAQDCAGVLGICARHPTQLYEAVLEGLLLLIILTSLAYLGFFKFKGFICGSFIMLYGSARFFVEFFRVPDPQFVSPENPFGFAFSIESFGLTMGQLLSLPMVFFGLFLILFSVRISIRGRNA